MLKKALISVFLVVAGGLLGLGSGAGLAWMSSAHERKFLDSSEGQRLVAARQAMGPLMQTDLMVQRCLRPKDARQGLLVALESIQKTRASLTLPELVPLLGVQSGVDHGRLALLEESSGDKQAFKIQMTAAREAFKNAGWNDYSEQVVRQVVHDIDAESNKACKAPSGGDKA